MERSGGDMRRAGFSGLQRRRAGFRDSREEDGSRQMELQEMVRVRDREMFQKKDRDREFSKRRRVERQTTRNESYRELESSDSSDEDSDEEEEEEDDDHQQKMKIHQQNRMNPPPPAPTSARSNHRRSLRTLRSTPVTRTAVDELIGVPIPRRARSSSFKRVHEHWSSGNGGLGEELNRRKFSPSPATVSPIGGGGSSPSSSGGSSMKKKRKSVEPRNRTLNSGASNSKLTVPDDIEFEVAEALFDLMKQSQSSKNVDDDDGEGKRLKKADDVRQDENGGFSAQIDQSIEESKKEEHGEKEKEMVDEQVEDEKSVSAKESESPSSSSCVKVNACIIQDPTVTKTNDGTVSVENKKDGGKGKLDIDLMAPPISASSRGKDLVVDTTSNPMAMVMSHEAEKERGTVQKEVSPASVLPLVATNGTTSGSKLLSLDLENNASGASTSNGNKELQTNILQNPFATFTTIPMNVWPGVLPHPGYMAPLQAVLPVDGSTRPSAAVVQTPQFQFSQPRRKRCATHRYLAVNIQSHQQLVNKSFTSGFSGSTTNLYGMKQLNLHSKSQPENLFSGDGGPKVTAMSGVNGKDKSSDVAKSLNTPMSNTLASQQASAQKFLQGPFILPFGQHKATAVGSSGNASGQHLSAAVVGDASMPSNGALNLCFPAMSLNHQNMLTNEAISPYMAMLQKNGCQFPIPPNSTLQKNGSQVPVVPFFNSSFYSSQMFNISPNQQHLSLPHALVQSSPQNTSTSSGSSSRKPPLGQKQTGANVSDGKSSADVGRNPLIPSNSQMFSNLILPVNGGLPKNGEPQQKGSSGRDFTQQALAMSFGLNSSMNSALNFQMLPDMSQNAYQKSFQASDGKSAVANANPQDEPKSVFGRMETGSQSLNFNKSGPSDVSATMGASLFDGLARNINMVPSTLTGKQAPPSSGTSVAIPNFTNFHQHQQQLIQLQKHHMQQIQLSGPPKDGNPGPFLSSNFPSSNTIFGRAENSSFPPQWDNMPRTAADGSSQSAAHSILMSFPQQLKGSQGQTHISFGNMPASSSAFQGQHIGSSSNSSILKNVAGGLRTPSAAPQQQADVSQQQNGSSQKSSSPACRRNVPSILSTCPSQPSELKY